MLLTDEQIREISRIIEEHHAAFVANAIGPEAVDPELLERLKKQGVVNVKIASVKDAYLFGHVVSALESADVTKMGYDDFKEWVSKNPIPLSPVEQRAIEVASQRAGQYAVALGKRVDLETGQTMLEEDQRLARRMRDQIEDATALNIAKRETVKQLVSDLGHRTGDWARDLDRIAATELHNAHQEGIADGIAGEYGDDAWVFKRPMPDACPACRDLHLGGDGQPMIWRLSALVENGTNVGKKRADWLPVVGPIHPWCQCSLVRLPDGWGFNEEGQVVPGGKLGERYEQTSTFDERRQRREKLKKSLLAGRANFQGLPIGIENPAGSVRAWRTPEGHEGSTHMQYAYGFVEGTQGMDGDEVDVFIGPNPDADTVFVVHQQNPRTGIWDEDKNFLGFDSEEAALQAYRAHYDRADFELTCTPISMDHFQRWIQTTKAGPQEGLAQPEKRPTGPKFVIPLTKALKTESGSLQSAYGAQYSQAGNRAPGPGVGANYLLNTPPRPALQSLAEQGHTLQPREMVTQAAHRAKARKRDKRIYNYAEPLGSVVKPMVIPEWFEGDRKSEAEEIKRRKKQAIEFGTRNLMRPRNNVEVKSNG